MPKKLVSVKRQPRKVPQKPLVLVGRRASPLSACQHGASHATIPAGVLSGVRRRFLLGVTVCFLGWLFLKCLGDLHSCQSFFVVFQSFFSSFYWCFSKVLSHKNVQTPRRSPGGRRSSPKRRVAKPWKGEAGAPFAPGRREGPPKTWGVLESKGKKMEVV